jgi:hypothetical protein
VIILFLINCTVVATAVVIHYEFLYRLTRIMPRLKVKHRLSIVVAVFTALIAHTIEIFIFAIAYFGLQKNEHWGELTGNFDGSFADCVYFSFTTFTTLGFGDIEPLGAIRYLVGIESLTGLILITWTASFLYIEMKQYWNLK